VGRFHPHYHGLAQFLREPQSRCLFLRGLLRSSSYVRLRRLGINDVIPAPERAFKHFCAECAFVHLLLSPLLSVPLSTIAIASHLLCTSAAIHVLVHFEDRPSKSHPHYRGPFAVVSPADDSGNYYTCKDMIQFNEYDVHVERMKPFDMSRTSLQAQAQRQLPSRDLLIVTGVDGHRMNEKLGFSSFCICFYSGFRAWRLYPEVQNLDAVKHVCARAQAQHAPQDAFSAAIVIFEKPQNPYLCIMKFV